MLLPSALSAVPAPKSSSTVAAFSPGWSLLPLLLIMVCARTLGQEIGFDVFAMCCSI